MSLSMVFRVRFVIFCMGCMALSISRRFLVSVLVIVFVRTAVSRKMGMYIMRPIVRRSQLGRGRVVAVMYVGVADVADVRRIFADDVQSMVML